MLSIDNKVQVLAAFGANARSPRTDSSFNSATEWHMCLPQWKSLPAV